jgi:hypothetical protein
VRLSCHDALAPCLNATLAVFQSFSTTRGRSDGSAPWN